MPRGARVVYEIENRKLESRFSTRSANDDFPAPEGADTTISVPRSVSEVGVLLLDILALLSELLHFGLDYYSRVADGKVV